MALAHSTKAILSSNPMGLAVSGTALLVAVAGVTVTEPDATHPPERPRQSAKSKSVAWPEEIPTPGSQSGIHSVSPAKDLELRWDASSDAVGYRVYWGTTPTGYDDVEDVGNVSEAVVSDLDPTKQYHFAVTAYAEDGTESIPTNDVQGP